MTKKAAAEKKAKKRPRGRRDQPPPGMAVRPPPRPPRSRASLADGRKFKEETRLENISSGGAYFSLDSGVVVGSKLNLYHRAPGEAHRRQEAEDAPRRHHRPPGEARQEDQEAGRRRPVQQGLPESSPKTPRRNSVRARRRPDGRDRLRQIRRRRASSREKGCCRPFRRPGRPRADVPGRTGLAPVVARFGPGDPRRRRDDRPEAAGRHRLRRPGGPGGRWTPRPPPGPRPGPRGRRRLEEDGRCRIFVSEAALIIEAGFAPFFDRIVVVSCREDVRLRAPDGHGTGSAGTKPCGRSGPSCLRRKRPAAPTT